MPKLTLDDFLTQPEHKEKRDFMSGIIDARIKELMEQRAEEKKKSGEKGNQKQGDAGSFFDDIFGGNDE